jgi:pimeloyl-ACP methyl ester carboxylesterase
LRGHGKSGKPHEPSQYGREMALDLVRLLDHLGLRRAQMLGYSLGAHVVAQLLTLHPDRLASAVLAGSCGRRHWSPDDDRRVEIEARELEQGLLRTQLARLQPPDAPALSETAVRKMSAKLLAGNDNAALAAMRRSNRDQVIDDAQLAAARVPLLGIVGGNDPYLASFRALAASVPRFRVVVVDGATHNSLVAHRQFLRTVHEFLREHAEGEAH